MLHDVFICHASEDKDDFVRPLASRLVDERVDVWFDEFTLNVGDSLRRSIDRGLSQSRFGVVILSRAFLSKQWPQWELDGLVARQNASTETVILPVWHGLKREDVAAYSPSLADKVAADSSGGLDHVVQALLSVIRPRGSTLVIARDHLIAKGLNPPVVTDDWWLDVAASAESNDQEGLWHEPMGWGRWGFPLPRRSDEPTERGWRMACAAMQDMWQEKAEELPVTQITRPEVVLNFIADQPGLLEACDDNLHYLITYAPLLTIRGCGGEYEEVIEHMFREAVANQGQPGRKSLSRYDDFFLRDPGDDLEEAARAACGFVQGNYVVNGPPVRYYYPFDYAAWTLSDESAWLPPGVRSLLRRGIAAWGVWFWYDHSEVREVPNFEAQAFTGRFSDAVYRARSLATLRLSGPLRRDLQHRLEGSARWLKLPESGEALAARLLESDFLECYYDKQDRRRRRVR